jgi:hypothetical protein
MQRETQVIAALNNHVGTVSLAGLHRIFSSGGKLAEPGSLSILLCQPKGASAGSMVAYNEDKVRV